MKNIRDWGSGAKAVEKEREDWLSSYGTCHRSPTVEQGKRRYCLKQKPDRRGSRTMGGTRSPRVGHSNHHLREVRKLCQNTLGEKDL